MLAWTIHDTARKRRRGELDAGQAVVDAAVHGWYEGHVEGHAAKGAPSPVKRMADPCPAPPFPATDSTELESIVGEASRRFTREAIDAAIAFAAGLGWAAGLREGAACPGCVTPGARIRGAPDATAVRDGHEPLVLDDDELADAVRTVRADRR